ncbi:uncharacterized protein FA14DRAFT_175995 [Meira miltonrushii]|uniref:Trichohyalin n=1 Tax=Meira miltonrushii TaxID=1280837 RepID=A0A316VGC5_9BASI|nr:uncharacterized protein FA14DRAFT_175995 [Meira miltonrushii]PWN36687.1 hypothetical protein FA14DRAFT_175995 [Meira miltonrushii]
MNIRSISIALILILSLKTCSGAKGGSASGSQSPPESPQNLEIDWSGFGNLVDIDKDPEWNAYHRQTSESGKESEQHHQVSSSKAVDDDGFHTNAKTKRGQQEARRLWLLKKNDPEKYSRLRRNIYARYRRREKEKSHLLSPEVAQQRYEQGKKSRAKYRVNYKQKTGFTRPESVELNRIREREKNKEATPEELAKLEEIYNDNDPAFPVTCLLCIPISESTNDLRGSNHPARGLDIDLNQPALETGEEVDGYNHPATLSPAADPGASENAAAAAVREKKKILQQRYREKLSLDPLRKAKFLAKQRKQQTKYRERIKATQTDQQKQARAKQISLSYFRRKNTLYSGFSSHAQRERHRIKKSEKEGKANLDDLEFIEKLREGDRNRKRKQAWKEKSRSVSNINYDMATEPPGTALTKSQRYLVKLKKDPIRYEEHLVKKRATVKEWKKKLSEANLSPEEALILKAKKAVTRSKTYYKQKQKYGGAGLKHRFELERLREKVNAGLGNEEDVKKLDEADRIRKEKKSIRNRRNYLNRKAKGKGTETKRAGLSIDLNQPAPEESEEEHTTRKTPANRKRVLRDYYDKRNANSARKEAHLERRRKRERIWRANRFNNKTEAEKQAIITRTQKRKTAAYFKRKQLFDGMSSKKEMKRHRILTLQKEGKEVPQDDLEFLHSLRDFDRIRARKLRSTRSSKKVQDAPKSMDSPWENVQVPQPRKTKKSGKFLTEEEIAQRAIRKRDQKRLSRKRYRQKLKMDPVRRAILYPKKNKANREYMARRFETLTDEEKVAYREHINSLHKKAAAKRKHNREGFNTHQNQERHNETQMREKVQPSKKGLERLEDVKRKRRAKYSKQAQPQRLEIDLNQPATEWDDGDAQKKHTKPYNKNAASRTPEMQKVYKQRWRAKIQEDPERLKGLKERSKASHKKWKNNLSEEKKAAHRARGRVNTRKSRLRNKEIRYGGFSSSREFQRFEIVNKQDAGTATTKDLDRLEHLEQ